MWPFGVFLSIYENVVICWKMVIYFHESNSVLKADFYLFILCCAIEVFLGGEAIEMFSGF